MLTSIYDVIIHSLFFIVFPGNAMIIVYLDVNLVCRSHVYISLVHGNFFTSHFSQSSASVAKVALHIANRTESPKFLKVHNISVNKRIFV